MLMIDKVGIDSLAKLREELAWLRKEHPEKTALIAVAENCLRMIEIAGGTKGTAYASNKPVGIHSETPEQYKYRHRDVFVPYDCQGNH